MSLQDDIRQIQRECSFFASPPLPQTHAAYLFDYSICLVLYKEVTSSICTSVTILATVIRLFVRRSVYWYDDLAALLSMFFLIAHMGIIVTITPSTYALHFYPLSAVFYCTVWLARLSILLTIIRIYPEERRRPLFAVVIIFIILPAILIGQVFWVCAPQQKLQNICQPSKQLGIAKLVSDMIADLFLLITSLHLFLVIQDKTLRFRLRCLFSTCVITTVVSIINCSFILISEGVKVAIIGVVEGSVSLIVANIPALSSVFIVGEYTSQRANRSIGSSILQFVHPTVTDTQASEPPIPDTTDKTIKTTLPTADVTTQERHNDPESNPDNDNDKRFEVL